VSGIIENVYIVGAGGQGQVFADLLLSLGIVPSGFFDNNPEFQGKAFLNTPVIGTVTEARNVRGKFLLGIGNNKARKKVVSHHCELEDFSFMGPNAVLGGKVKVGEGAFIGIGASIIPGIKIGKWSVIGAGSVIIKDVPDYATVVGNPGRIIKIKRE
jgi:carbonic anhydrase/acetyltransferase-like protein (isoleucine patch superfamily)